MLVLHLRGPMAAFGAVAVDATIPVAAFPPLSFVTGLLSNALGHERRSYEMTERLQKSLQFAARAERRGFLETDFQTGAIRKDDKAWTTRGRTVGRAGGADTYDSPALTYKQYWADQAMTVMVEFSDLSLEGEVAHALCHPARPLFLGRVSFPPSAPLLVGVVEGPNVLAALEAFPAVVADAPAECVSQWPSHLGDGRPSTTRWVVDAKDWQGRLHTGRRAVREGMTACPRQPMRSAA